MRNVLRLGTAAGLAGCATLPTQAFYASQIVKEGDLSETAAPRFLVTDLTPTAVAIVKSYPRPTLVGRFGNRGSSPPTVIGVGALVQMTVWEAESSGLFSSQSIAGFTAGLHSASIPEQVVSRDNTNTVPYAGNLRVAGRTPHEVGAMIVSRLAGKAIERQAIVTVSKNASSIATVLGEGTAGSRIPLSLRGDCVLDVIASAGGIRALIPELFVALSRGAVTAWAPMQALVARPSENIYVHPKDVVTVIREPQTYKAFGATGRNALVPFDAVGISLDGAAAKAEGTGRLPGGPAGRVPAPLGAGQHRAAARPSLPDPRGRHHGQRRVPGRPQGRQHLLRGAPPPPARQGRDVCRGLALDRLPEGDVAVYGDDEPRGRRRRDGRGAVTGGGMRGGVAGKVALCILLGPAPARAEVTPAGEPPPPLLGYCAPPVVPACIDALKECPEAVKGCALQVEAYEASVFAYRVCISRNSNCAVREATVAMAKVR